MKQMKETILHFGSVEVRILDPSSHEERKKNLEKPLQDFYYAVCKELKEKGIKLEGYTK